MHLVNSYSLASAAKIDKPRILEKFFPLSVEKYIVIQPFSKPSKSYDFWDDVIKQLAPILSKEGVTIVQIGGKNEKPLRNCYVTSGQTNLGQTAYIISKCMLFLGCDSFGAHIASHYGRKIVSIYSNNYIECVKPFWTKDSDGIFLEPERNGKRPSFSFVESPKTINEIKPEKIVESVLKLLKIDYENKLNSVYFGESYANRFIETLPNQILDVNQFGIDSFVSRMDFLHNENILMEQLKVCKCSIVTSKPISKNLLQNFRHNIKDVIYRIDKESDPSFLDTLAELNLNHFLITHAKGEDLNEIKFKYLDHGNINTKSNIEEEKNKVLKLLNGKKGYYTSSKITLSEGKIYPSYQALLDNNPVDSFDFEPQPIVDSEDFWKEIEHFKILTLQTE